MKKFSKFLAVLLVFSMILPGIAQAAPVVAEDVVRLEGKGRVETAVEISKTAFADKADAVVLAGYNGEVDALAGTLLAKAKNASLLFTTKGALSAATKAEIERLGAKTIYILGEEGVVSKDVETAFDSSYTVKRIAGKDRVATAAAVAKEVNAKATKVFLAKGYDNYADALAAGPASAKTGMPILLTQSDKLPQATIDAMVALGVTEVTIVGGEGAVSKAVADQLTKYTVNRIEGTNRERTAVAIANKFFAGSTNAIVANGYVFADSLAGGYLAAKINAPIILTAAARMNVASNDYLKANAAKAWVLGGVNAVNKDVFNTVEVAVAGDEAEELYVESVNIVNLKTVEFKFSKAVLANTVIDKSTEDSEGFSNIQTTNITFTALDSGASVTVSKAKLSEDAKTLTVRTSAAFSNEKFYSISLIDTQDLNANKIVPFAVSKKIMEKTAPVVLKTTAVTNQDKTRTIEIEFSEPVEFTSVKVGSKFAQSAATGVAFGDKYIITSSEDLKTGQTYTIEFNGLKDLAGNIASSQTATVQVVRDEVRPSVTSVTQINEKQFDVKFDKNMASGVNVDSFVVKVTPTGSTTSLTVAQSGLAVRRSDNQTFRVTLANAPFENSTQNSREIKVEIKGLKDSLGNTMNAETKNITITRDVIKPTMTNVRVVPGTANKLEVTLSELAIASDGTALGLVSTGANVQAIFGLTDTNGNIVRLSDGATPILVNDIDNISSENKVILTLDNGLTKSASYNLVLKQNSVKDTADVANKNDAKVLSFSFSKASTPITQLTATITDKYDGINQAESRNAASTNKTKNKIVIEFNTNDVVNGLNQATGAYENGAANNPANYTIDGKVLPQGTIVTFNDATPDTVTLDFENVLTKNLPDAFAEGGNLVVGISNIKSQAGSTLNYTTKSVEVLDKTEPVMKEAFLTGSSVEYKLTVVFSEEMSAAIVADFVLSDIDGVATLSAAAIDATDAKKVTFTVVPGDADANLAKALTLKTASSVTGTFDKATTPNAAAVDTTGIAVINYAQ